MAHSTSQRPRAFPEGKDTHEDAGLRVEVRSNAVLEVSLARPGQRNALTPQMIERLTELLRWASADRDIHAVLVTGEGQAFCGGFDIARINSPGGQAVGAERDMVEDLATTLMSIPHPVIAVVNGAAVGAGCDLALACDLRIGTPRSRFGMPPAKLGIVYGWRGMQRLVSTVGLTAAKELLLTADLIDAQKAYEIGLLSKIVDAEALLREGRSLATRLTANAPLALTASKRSLHILAMSGISEREVAELNALQRKVWTSEDAKEGARAFREGRPPSFTGK